MTSSSGFRRISTKNLRDCTGRSSSRETLMRRYRATQNDVYYLTGAMQLHAVRLMQPDSMADVMIRIAQSQGPGDGSATAVLTRALASFCPASISGVGQTSVSEVAAEER